VDGEITPFFSDMPAAFAQADLVVSRAGAGTVSELAAAGKPSILVPLPTASDQHQLRNAQAFERAGASRLLLDSETTGPRLVEEIAKISNQLDQMAAAVRSLAHPGAARRAAEVLETFLK
jgi:UDP-N-acetylglucosamine--N-acetylmuramyl-(pentapeptide) pyrophosphoryl-undecaprenol N-acetylglucosamine transferase